MRRTTIFITERQEKILRGIRKDSGLSIAEIIRRAIDKYTKEFAIDYRNQLEQIKKFSKEER